MISECPVCKNYRFIIESDVARPIHCLKCNWNRQYKLKEIDICLKCGQPWPCKLGCLYGTDKALIKQ